MTRRGRKPLALEHVQQLDGSARAKQRMTTLLKTLEPQPPGRRPKERRPECARIEQLEQEVRALRRELALTQALCEVIAPLGAEIPGLVKKGPPIS